MILMSDFTRSTICFIEKIRLNPAAGLSLLSFGDTLSREMSIPN